MRFRYPLQKVLDLKMNETSQAEWMLSQALSELHALEEKLQALHGEIDFCRAKLASESHMTISDMLMVQQYTEHLSAMQKQQEREITKAQGAVLERRQELQRKMLDEKVWQNAKEKARSQFNALFLKQEQERLDEMATIRHARASGTY
ncbi:flagellar export protein FliJ [Paenibacillus turpanensis]|uniref:flagellar export protein FliJ n=1 Tax=Paenibacillus turpanensis TaxID=2689078 RepID=UPI0014076F09|nr:flagellar export protein FliJ [Paenibacillus turpanensis]